MLPTGFHKSLIRALHDALAANINPATRRHLAVHHQAGTVELVEVLPVGPLRHQIGVGQQDTRRAGVGTKHADRFARLNQQGFIGLQRAQAVQDRVVTRPIARCFANATIDHKFVGVFGDLWVEVVLQHTVGRLNLPVGTTQSAATGRAHRAGFAFKIRGLRQIRHRGLLNKTGFHNKPSPVTLSKSCLYNFI